MNDTLPRQLQLLFPTALPGVDYLVIDRGSGPVIENWKLTATQPTADQLAAAATQVAAIDTLRSNLLAAFTALPSGVQAAFHDCLHAVDKLLLAGQTAEAKDLINTTPVIDSLLPTRAALVAMFP